DIEDQLKRSPRARFRLIVVEGVYGLDSQIAPMDEIVRIAREYDALILLHDSLGTGVLGERGRGTAEFHNVLSEVDLISGSFGQCLSGFELGYIVGSRNIVDWLKQNSKPYVFSASPPPMS